MLFSSLFTLALAAVAAASDSYCQQSPYNIIEPFANYQPAKDYCTKTYPVSKSTKTSCHWYTKTHWTTHYPTTTKTTTTTPTVTVTTTTVSRKLGRRAATNSAKSWSSCKHIIEEKSSLSYFDAASVTASSTNLILSVVPQARHRTSFGRR